jgi:hypothetical protein
MKTSLGEAVMRNGSIGLVTAAAILAGTAAMAQTAREVLGPAAVVPLAEQPPAKIIVDPPLAEPLSRGLVFIQYRTENLRIVPVFGPKALDVSPRIGHIHVVVDDAPWHWADASGEPLIPCRSSSRTAHGSDHPGKREPPAFGSCGRRIRCS